MTSAHKRDEDCQGADCVNDVRGPFARGLCMLAD